MSSRVSAPHGRPMLGSLLRLASQFMSEKFSRWIESSGFEGVQPSHSAAIQPLWEMPDGARITTLARASRITKQSMSTLISELEGAGYVERIKDPDDARATRVRLTERGRSYARAVRTFSRSVESDLAERIGLQRIEELCATLELLRTKVFLVAK